MKMTVAERKRLSEILQSARILASLQAILDEKGRKIRLTEKSRKALLVYDSLNDKVGRVKSGHKRGGRRGRRDTWRMRTRGRIV